MLVHAVNHHPDIEKLLKAHKLAMRAIPKIESIEFKPPDPVPHPRSSYIVLMDAKIVIFYTNDLAQTFSCNFLRESDKEAIACVRGLAPTYRWTGK